MSQLKHLKKERKSRCILKRVCLLGLAGITFAFAQPSSPLAGDKEDMEDMQRNLNKQVMSQPFSAGDIEKIDVYVEDAMKKDLKPTEKAPKSWRPGGTCADLTDFGDYRDCIYYYRYYGYYWR